MTGNNDNNNPVAARPRQPGTGFVNLQRVIGANRGNQLGSAISSGVRGTVNTAGQQLNKSYTDFQNKLNQSRLDTDQNKSLVQNTLANPVNASDAVVNKFADWRTKGYQGPSSLANEGELRTQALQAKQLGQEAADKNMRMNLLQRYAGGNQYTAGQQRLDNLLLGSTGVQGLKDTKRQAVQLGQKVNQTAEQSRLAAQQAKTASNAFVGDVQSQISAQKDPLYQTFQQRAAEQGSSAQQAYNDFLSRINEHRLTAEDAQKLEQYGITPTTDLFDLNLADVYRAGSGYNASTAATPEEAARYNALTRLAGVESELDPSKIGQYEDPLVATDLAGRIGDLTRTRNQEYLQAIQPYQPTIDKYQGHQDRISKIYNDQVLAQSIRDKEAQLSLNPGNEELRESLAQDKRNYVSSILTGDAMLAGTQAQNLNSLDPYSVNSDQYYSATQALINAINASKQDWIRQRMEAVDTPYGKGNYLSNLMGTGKITDPNYVDQQPSQNVEILPGYSLPTGKYQ